MKKKPKSEKFVALNSYVKPEHKAKVEMKAKKLKVKESAIIRDLIENAK